MTAAEQATRLVNRFTWDAVDRSLIRRLLDSAYDVAGDKASRKALGDQPDDRMPELADRAFGTPPALRHIDVLIDPLRTDWLEKIDDGDPVELVGMIQLGLTAPARDLTFRSRDERLEFVRARRRTHNHLVHLRRAFLRAHRRPMPVRPGPERGPADMVKQTLLGAGVMDPRRPYPHQLSAWSGLDRMTRGSGRAERSGLLVLPTGAGKTYTAVRWLVEQMARDEQVKVLWIADRQELVEQAASTFLRVAASQAVGFERTLRRIHSGASTITTLADPALDIAVVTRQSLRAQDQKAKGRIRKFVGERPTIVVVDEAHHAIAPTYEEVLDFLQETCAPLLIGLTATPWPSGNGATARLHQRFPVTVATADVGELVRLGVLAQPVHCSVDTGVHVELTDEERTTLVGDADLPPSVLRRFDSERRNDLVVQTWWEQRKKWGKSLVFAVDIDHADRLHAMFHERGAEAAVVHSRTETHRHEILEWFRAVEEPAVLVSVGMLTEGVDLPDARTAVLARPTTSRVLMRQMIGRVLRGPRAGGDSVAHVVDVRDRWDVDVDVLRPPEIPGIGPQPATVEPSVDGYRLPVIVDELTAAPVPEDVLHRVVRSYRERIRGRSGPPAVTSTALIGFYRLDDLSAPVFQHTSETYRELIASRLAGRPLGVRSPVDLFGDLPLPRPLSGDVKAVDDFVRSSGIEPPFEPLQASVDVREIARELSALSMTPTAQAQWLRGRFDSTLAGMMFGTFPAFYEAVHRALVPTGSDPENPSRSSGGTRPAEKLGRTDDRDLSGLLRQVRERAHTLLSGDDPHYVDLLKTQIEVSWTRRDLQNTFAYWTPRINGKRRGQPMIYVNARLRAPRAQISDAVLEYLLWHEVVHHLLPGQGHDSEFRRLEALWPESEVHDHFLDTLHERFDMTG